MSTLSSVGSDAIESIDVLPELGFLFVHRDESRSGIRANVFR